MRTITLSRLMSAVVAVMVPAMIVLGSASASPAQAQTRITVPGAGPLYYPRIVTQLPLGRLYLLGTAEAHGSPLSILEGYDLLNHVIGQNWFPGTTAQVVNYPASIGIISGSLNAPRVDDAVETGRASLDEQIKTAAANGDKVVIAGLSEGTVVINRELAHLATDPNAPGAELLSFVMFSSPEFGLANTYFPTGLTLPLINYTAHDLADSQYDVSVVFHQYDAWADLPDRPWNLLSLVNSLFGTLYYHNNVALAVPSDAVEVARTKSALGGTTTTYMVASSIVPILKPLQQFGVPSQIVEALNSVVKPIIDAGYSRLAPDAGPYFSHGQLRGLPAPFGSPTAGPDRTAPPVMAASIEAAVTTTDVANDPPPVRIAKSGRRVVDSTLAHRVADSATTVSDEEPDAEEAKKTVEDSSGNGTENQGSQRHIKLRDKTASHSANGSGKSESLRRLTAAGDGVGRQRDEAPVDPHAPAAAPT